MFAAVVVIMLCAVAIVGVGYAYNASTTNSGNKATSEYLVIHQTSYQLASNADIEYDTNTSVGETIQWTFTSPTEITVSNVAGYNGAYSCKKINGESVGITTTGVNHTAADRAITVSSTSFNLTSGWYFIVDWVSNGSHYYSVCNSTDNWNGSLTLKVVDSAYATTSYDLYYGYKTDTVPTTAPAVYPIGGAETTGSIVFSASIS